MAKEVVKGIEFISKIKEALEEMTEVVGSTFGPCGANVMLQRGLKNPVITKDGISVAKEFSSDDSVKNMTMSYVKQACRHAVKITGDGTTTTVLLTNYLYGSTIKKVMAGKRRIDVVRELKGATKTIIDEIIKTSKPISDIKELHHVAMISTNGDDELSSMLSKAVSVTGVDGIVKLKEGRDQDKLVIEDGLLIPNGHINPGFIVKDETIWDTNNPYVIATDMIIDDVADLETIAMAIGTRSALIICSDMTGPALQALTANVQRGRMNVTVIKAPGFGDKQTEYLLDIMSAVEGGTIIHNTDGEAEDIVKAFGVAERVTVTPTETTIIPPASTAGDIESRVNMINTLINNANSTKDENMLKERKARLIGKVATVFIGGYTEVERKEKYDRADDAIGALRVAARGGVIYGGGKAFFTVTSAAKSQCPNDKELKTLHNASKYIIARLAINAEVDTQDVMDAYKSCGYMYDFINDEPITLSNSAVLFDPADYSCDTKTKSALNEDMLDTDILDPTLVLTTALESSVSVVSTLLLAKMALVAEDGQSNGLNEIFN